MLVSRYRIQGYLGGGGFGHIYMAEDTALGHRRAIKEAFTRDLAAQQQFRLEAEFLLNARHPNLVRGYAVFEQEGRLYLVMDYVDGHTLEDIAIEYIRRTGRALGEAQVLDWMIPVCEAAHALHTQPVPIIHRDIKPANIKLSASLGIPILIDLGLAKLYAVGSQTLGAALAFTPGYAPPEQYQAAGATDQRTDVYGLGATLYYLLTGYQPTEAPARLSAEALRPPRSLNPLVSEATEACVLRAMELNPALRQQSAHQLADELRAASAAVTARATLSIPYAVAGVAASPPAPAMSGQSPRLCTHCGSANEPTARYCMGCGATLPAVPPAAQVHIRRTDSATAPRAGSAVLWPAARLTPQSASTGVPPWQAPPPASLPRLASPPEMLARSPLPTGMAISAAFPGMPNMSYLDGGAWSARLGIAGFRGRLATPHGDSMAYQPPTQHEAWTSIFALLALVCCSLSLTAAFAPGMLIFLLPALIFGVWSTRYQAASAPWGFRWLARAAIVLSGVWLVLWVLVMLVMRAR